MSQIKSCISTIVMSNAVEGTLLKYLVTSPLDVTNATTAALGGTGIAFGAQALWSDIEYTDGTCQRLYRKNRLGNEEEEILSLQPAVSVFFSWGGLCNGLMFDRRLHPETRGLLRKSHYSYVQHRLDKIRSVKPYTATDMHLGNEIFAYLHTFKHGDPRELPELPEIDLGHASGHLLVPC